jgi:uncharacterized lipoprotein YehR (DUF1307 family)
MKILGILCIIFSTVTLAVAGNTSVHAEDGQWVIDNVSGRSINVTYSYKDIKTGQTFKKGPIFLNSTHNIIVGETSTCSKPVVLSDKFD